MSKDTVAHEDGSGRRGGDVRTSISFPRDLVTQAKLAAINRDETLQKLCNDALREYLKKLSGEKVHAA